MKIGNKRIFFFLLVFVLFVVNSHSKEVVAKSEIKVYINDKRISFPDVKPIKENNEVLVPVRVVQENMEAEVKWDNKEKRVTTVKTNGNQTTKITYAPISNYIFHEYNDGNTIKVNVEKIEVSSKVKKKRMMVPLKAAAEALGFTVVWNDGKNIVKIKTGKSIEPKKNNSQYKVVGDYLKINEIELDLFYLTNKKREDAGIPSLEYSAQNGEMAKLKSKDMHDKKYFAHESPTYGSAFEMLERFGISYKLAGENLAAGFQTPEETVEGWMNSQGHKENLLRPDFKTVGFGYYEGPNEYKKYYTQIFTTN